jgi:hypothetical protein
MPIHAASKQIRTAHNVPSVMHNSEESSTQSGNDSRGYQVKHPNIASVPKAKSGEYAHTLYSVVDRGNTVPLFIRVLNTAHIIVHHPVSQAVDCLLSIYIGQELHRSLYLLVVKTFLNSKP